MKQMSSPPDMGRRATSGKMTWVQTERAAHEAWARFAVKKPTASALLHHLVARMGPQNAVVISQKLLAKVIGCTVRTVQRSVADLVEARWIQVVRLNGPGTVSAYVVNDTVAWGQRRGDIAELSTFSAQVVADREDQTTLAHDDLRTIPTIFPGEQAMPTGEGEEPPAQALLPGLEPVIFRDSEGRLYELDEETGEVQQRITDEGESA